MSQAWPIDYTQFFALPNTALMFDQAVFRHKKAIGLKSSYATDLHY